MPRPILLVMPARATTAYVCQSCGFQAPKWIGRCPECHGWNTLVEERVVAPPRGKGTPRASRDPIALDAVPADAEERMAEISAAKLQLSRGGWFVQENAIQLLGGIGVTDEQDEGLFFKRLRVLQGLFGDADFHVDRFQRLERFARE